MLYERESNVSRMSRDMNHDSKYFEMSQVSSLFENKQKNMKKKKKKCDVKTNTDGWYHC